jgi:hypothetical protein
MTSPNRRLLTLSFCFTIFTSHRAQSVPINQTQYDSRSGSHSVTELNAIIIDTIPYQNQTHFSAYLFRPAVATPVPVIFFCHGITADDPSTYGALIQHLVSQGYAVAYLPYSSAAALVIPAAAYQTMWEGCEMVVRQRGRLIDTTRIGFAGHSYGGGAAPSLIWRALHEKAWGANGAFLFVMAPWYVREISNRQLRRFPPQVRCVVQIYSDDHINDFRMAEDLFDALRVPAANKCFITVFSAPGIAGPLTADHDLPTGSFDGTYMIDALDSIAVFQPLGETAADAFSAGNSIEGQSSGIAATTRWKQCVEIRIGLAGNGQYAFLHRPLLKRPQYQFRNFWSHAFNTRLGLGNSHENALHPLIHTPITVFNYYRHLQWLVVSKS